MEINGAQRTHKGRLQNEETSAWWLGLAENFPSSLFSSNGKLVIRNKVIFLETVACKTKTINCCSLADN